MHGARLWLPLLAALVKHAASQLTPWKENQINTSICTWSQPRAALIRDTVYLDGGRIWMLSGFDDGTVDPRDPYQNAEGRVFTYNFSEPFPKDMNTTAVLLKDDSLTKSLGGSGYSEGVAQNMIDGGMLANDAEFFLYGGAFNLIEEISDAPDDNEVLAYRRYEYGAEKSLFQEGFDPTTSGNKVRSYIAYGGAVSAPSENKAWYFSGMVSPINGPILLNVANETDMAVNVSNTLITLDMEEQLHEQWYNNTLPKSIKGRANAEVVWVPVGEEGILVVLGGVVYPEFNNPTHKSQDEDKSEEESPEFMKTIDIYDIANGEWYKQETEDGPSTRTRGCAVVAPASDYSSFNIYYYGGYDGIHYTDDFYDDVWVLSLPSFTWTQLNNGTALHARAGHKCFMPYPDQMMIFGGYVSAPGDTNRCLDGGPVVIFNLTSGEWMDSYDPTKYGAYSVPEKVRDAIGGDATGSATATTPVPSGWATSALEKVFATSYNRTKIQAYWPYDSTSSSERPNYTGDSSDNDDDHHSGLPGWVAPVLGVVLGLMFVTGVIVVFCLWRRRKILRNGPSEPGTEDAGLRILSWIKGQPSEKAPTVTTSEDNPASNPEMLEVEAARAVGSTTPSRQESVAPPAPYEMENTQVSELADTSIAAPPVELHDTGLTPVDVIRKHSRVGSKRNTGVNTPESFSFVANSTDHVSTVSRSSNDQPASNTRVTSDVSALSRPEHMRQLSDGTVSIESALEENRPRAAPRADSEVGSGVKSPVSPPSVAESAGEDYITARPLVSPLRRSVFRESEEDMGKDE